MNVARQRLPSPIAEMNTEKKKKKKKKKKKRKKKKKKKNLSSKQTNTRYKQ